MFFFYFEREKGWDREKINERSTIDWLLPVLPFLGIQPTTCLGIELVTLGEWC